MTVVDKRASRPQPAEDAIFVSGDGRRARRLRRAAAVATVLAVLWIVGLGLGMLGFGSLPGVSLVKQLGGSADSVDTPRAEKSPVSPAVRRRASEGRRVASQNSAVVRSTARKGAKPAAAKPAPARPAPRPPAQGVATPAPPAQQPVNPAQRPRGWARKGAPAPPGQARKTTPPPPPGTRGQRRGQDPTLPPPVPPGQQKKAQPPPPPPPEG